MPGIILTLRTVDRSVLKELGLSYARLVKQVLYETAEHWHRNIFPAHFGGQNQGKYQYTPRTAVYLQKIKRLHGVGEGKFRIQVLQGKSGRALRNLVRISGSSRQATVRMSAPGYFTNPFVGSWVDAKTGRVKRVTRQPNKPEEIVRKDTYDREKLRAFSALRLNQLITTARRASARTWAADGI
jgi:hypothetical protein